MRPYLLFVFVVAALYFACPARGQDFSVTFRPMPLRASEALIGSRDYGFWTAEIVCACSQLTRKAILDLGFIDGRPIPFIIDATLAENLIQNRVYMTRAAKAGRLLNASKDIAGPGLSLAGWAADVPAAGWAGLGLMVIDVAVKLSKGREPKPEDVEKLLMPAVVTLVNGQAVHTLLSAKMPNARAVLDVRPGPVLTTPITENFRPQQSGVRTMAAAEVGDASLTHNPPVISQELLIIYDLGGTGHPGSEFERPVDLWTMVTR